MSEETDKIIAEAITLLQETYPTVGKICAHASNKICYELIAYENDQAVFQNPGEEKLYYPAAEIFDVNVCKQVAQNIMFGIPPFLNINDSKGENN
jgi:hypothetical protein